MKPRVRFVYSNDPRHEAAIVVPPELGVPRPGHHLASTARDNLVEIAGRVCYDSLQSPRSRSTPEYHQHIIESKHTSVWDHVVFNFEIVPGHWVDDPAWLWKLMAVCANRPGVWTWTAKNDGKDSLRLTLNLRALREWKRWAREVPGISAALTAPLQDTLEYWAAKLVPLAMQDYTCLTLFPDEDTKLVKPAGTDETWVTLFFTGVSRGLSHELVRHNYETGKSQRSTRYCDECDSPWIPHPAFRGLHDSMWHLHAVQAKAAEAYRAIGAEVKAMLLAQGTDKATALKQSRGAARAVLGQALETELIFSASLSQWRRMLEQRKSSGADAEIREVFGEVATILCDAFPEYADRLHV